jgi:hypothetical protein
LLELYLLGVNYMDEKGEGGCLVDAKAGD